VAVSFSRFLVFIFFNVLHLSLLYFVLNDFVLGDFVCNNFVFLFGMKEGMEGREVKGESQFLPFHPF